MKTKTVLENSVNLIHFISRVFFFAWTFLKHNTAGWNSKFSKNHDVALIFAIATPKYLDCRSSGEKVPREYSQKIFITGFFLRKNISCLITCLTYQWPRVKNKEMPSWICPLKNPIFLVISGNSLKACNWSVTKYHDAWQYTLQKWEVCAQRNSSKFAIFYV